MQVYIVIMLCADDSEDNTQNMGVFASKASAEAFMQQQASEGLDCIVEEHTVQ